MQAPSITLYLQITLYPVLGKALLSPSGSSQLSILQLLTAGVACNMSILGGGVNWNTEVNWGKLIHTANDYIKVCHHRKGLHSKLSEHMGQRNMLYWSTDAWLQNSFFQSTASQNLTTDTSIRSNFPKLIHHKRTIFLQDIPRYRFPSTCAAIWARMKTNGGKPPGPKGTCKSKRPLASSVGALSGMMSRLDLSEHQAS